MGTSKDKITHGTDIYYKTKVKTVYCPNCKSIFFIGSKVSKFSCLSCNKELIGGE